MLLLNFFENNEIYPVNLKLFTGLQFGLLLIVLRNVCVTLVWSWEYLFPCSYQFLSLSYISALLVHVIHSYDPLISASYYCIICLVLLEINTYPHVVVFLSAKSLWSPNEFFLILSHLLMGHEGPIFCYWDIKPWENEEKVFRVDVAVSESRKMSCIHPIYTNIQTVYTKTRLG